MSGGIRKPNKLSKPVDLKGQNYYLFLFSGPGGILVPVASTPNNMHEILKNSYCILDYFVNDFNVLKAPGKHYVTVPAKNFAIVETFRIFT